MFLLFADLKCTECNFSLQRTLSLVPRKCAKAFLQNMYFLLRFDYGCSDEGKESPNACPPPPLSFFSSAPDVCLVLATRRVANCVVSQKLSFVCCHEECRMLYFLHLVNYTGFTLTLKPYFKPFASTTPQFLPLQIRFSSLFFLMQ